MPQATLTTDNDRPDDCECMQFPNSDSTLECWPCARDGFDGINPDAPVWEPNKEATA